ncbi:MAG TPA: TonB-dependent receptor [Gemmatimonadales bacterium]|nr:TonB-dependent receptor [Gemmatimonadales bacterium]
MISSRVVLRGALLAACTCAFATVGRAQDLRGSVEGVVLTAEGDRPVADATVGIFGLGRYVTSDSAGRFLLGGVPFGSQRVEVRAIGYQPAAMAVTIVPGDVATAEFRLKPAVVNLPEVVVSSSREAQLASTTPVSVGVIRGEEIRETRGHHPAEIVNRTPGVYVSNFGGEGHATAIRQPITTKALYAYLEDGVPIRSTGFFNHNALYEINIPQAGRLEVIKGPGTAVYGSDAIGGVVNAFTRDPSPHPEAELFLEGGSTTYVRGLGTASTSIGRSGFRADVNVTRSDGWREGTPYDRQSGTLRWDYHLSDRSRLKTVAAFSHIDQPGDGGSDLTPEDYAAIPSRTYSPIAFRRVKAARLSTELQILGETSSFGATLYTRYNELDLLPSWQLSFDPQVWESRHRSVGLLTRYRKLVAPLRTNLSTGVDLEYTPGSRLETGIAPQRAGQVFTGYTTGEVQYDYDVTFWQASPYAQADVSLPGRVQLSAGARYDHIGYDYDNRLSDLATGSHRRPGSTGVTFDRISPKLGATWELAPNANLFASYREAFRAPSESQLFRQGSAVSTVDLKPVRAESWEAGFRTALGGIVTLEATGYSMRLRDDILTFFDPTNGLRLTQNAGATNHRGVELGAGVGLARGLRLDGAVSYAKHTYVEWQPRPGVDYTGNEMELAPRFLGNGRLSYRPPFLSSGVVAVEWVKLGSYWMDPENTHKYEGHDLFNLFATVPVTAHLELSGRVTNLADSRFAETSSFNAQQGERFRPGAPRQFFLGAQYRFN